MIYSATSRGYTLNPGALSGESLHFWWFDPRDGTHIDLGVFPRSNLVEVTPPNKGEDIDWVLVVDDAMRGFSSSRIRRGKFDNQKGELRFR